MLHGDPTGNYSYTAMQYLYVGCTPSITLTQDEDFVDTLDVNCLSDEVGAYTFYASTVNNRSSYCAQLSHTIVNIEKDGDPSLDAVAFTETCTPTLEDPYSCSSIDLKETKTPHIVTFQIETVVEGVPTPFLSPVITIDVDCRLASRDSEIYSSIDSEILEAQLSVDLVYTFRASDFSCNCPEAFCNDYTYSVVTDSTGSTTHTLIPAPVYDADNDEWVVTINLQNEYEYLDFHIKATTSQGVSGISDVI